MCPGNASHNQVGYVQTSRPVNVWSANRKLAQVAPMSIIRIRLGHESLDVTLAYVKGKEAESEEAQEHANSSSLALYA
jgi:hypothetical protein